MCPGCGLARSGDEQFCSSCGSKFKLNAVDFKLKWWDWILLFIPFSVTLLFMLLAGIKGFEFEFMSGAVNGAYDVARYIWFDSMAESVFFPVYLLALLCPIGIVVLRAVGSYLVRGKRTGREPSVRAVLMMSIVLLLINLASVVAAAVAALAYPTAMAYNWTSFIEIETISYNRNVLMLVFLPAAVCAAASVLSFFLTPSNHDLLGVAFRSKRRLTAGYETLGHKTPAGKKENIPLVIFLSIITLSVYYFVWVWRTTRYLKQAQGDFSGCAGTVACMILVPFYSCFWYYKYARENYRQKKLRAAECDDFVGAVTVISIFVPLASAAIMIHNLNELKVSAQEKTL